MLFVGMPAYNEEKNIGALFERIGAGPSLKHPESIIAFAYAKSAGHSEIAKILRKAGAKE